MDWPNRVSNPWSTTLEESTLTITPLMRLRQVNMKKNIFFLWTFYINQCITDNIIKVYHQHTYTYFLLIFIFLTFFFNVKTPNIKNMYIMWNIFILFWSIIDLKIDTFHVKQIFLLFSINTVKHYVLVYGINSVTCQ